MTGPLPLAAKLIDDPHALADDPSQAARFVSGFLKADPASLIANAHSRMQVLSYGALRLPVTIEDGRLGGTYVASPHSAYVLYARDEIDIVGLTGAARLGAAAALALVDRWLKALSINRTVHIDNWMLSTSLHGRWDGTGLSTIRRAVTD
ncbi:MAG: hypothetical protein AAFQ13_13410, partial [Pseudomonadota bacterium]